ncbi:hypothetical protein FSARC_3029 [Fusarium sarcochroum]|uniref:Uncharacterized protein n=1 Tax=Fusarium sarcochroum TaxID=1208366 RepID=A0A8H4U5B0_9HYPO|nr:hypothetical protein FSARC_3029 [Fusarium sarcochroum]
MNDSKATGGNHPERLRILLQTTTHHVPGKDHGEKITFTKNIICQHLWKRDFDPLQERWYPYNDVFGLQDRKCFFLIDHFGFDHSIQEEQGPISVRWYKWNGDSLVQVHTDLPAAIRGELKKWPFTWEGRKFHRLPKNPDGTYSPTVYRRIV